MKIKVYILISVALIIIAMILITIIGSGCSLKDYPQDNIVEEKVEDLIQEETGLDIDLSPFSPEEIVFTIYKNRPTVKEITHEVIYDSSQTFSRS